MTFLQDASSSLPPWVRDIVDRELHGVDLASFQVLKETPLDKMGVGYTPSETFLIRKSLTSEEVFRLERPAEVFGEGGERVGCPSCGAVFRIWRSGGENPVHCMECGERIDTHVAPVGEMTPYEHTLERPGTEAHGPFPGVQRGELAAATSLRGDTPIPPLGKAPDLRHVPRPGTDITEGQPAPAPVEEPLEEPAEWTAEEPVEWPTEEPIRAPRTISEDVPTAGPETPYFPQGGESAYAPDVSAPYRGKGREVLDRSPEQVARREEEEAAVAPRPLEPHPLLTGSTAGAPLREAAIGHPAPSIETSELMEIEGIGPVLLNRLEGMDIFTLRDLAGADPNDVAGACDVPLAVAKNWQAQAELMLLTSVRTEEAALLVQNGVDGVRDLARRRPAALAEFLRERGVDLSMDTVERWIREASYRRDLV